MSIVAIRALLESRLAAITPALATAFENFPFTPINGTPWQRVNLMAAQPLNPTMGDGFRPKRLTSIACSGFRFEGYVVGVWRAKR